MNSHGDSVRRLTQQVDFDPYSAWLGLDKPPENHFQLLGLAVDEDSDAKIYEAFVDRSARVRPHQSGRNTDQAIRVLRELAVAMQVLHKSPSREAYRQQILGTSLKPIDWRKTLENRSEPRLAPTAQKVSAPPRPFAADDLGIDVAALLAEREAQFKREADATSARLAAMKREARGRTISAFGFAGVVVGTLVVVACVFMRDGNRANLVALEEPAPAAPIVASIPTTNVVRLPVSKALVEVSGKNAFEVAAKAMEKGPVSANIAWEEIRPRIFQDTRNGWVVILARGDHLTANQFAEIDDLWNLLLNLPDRSFPANEAIGRWCVSGCFRDPFPRILEEIVNREWHEAALWAHPALVARAPIALSSVVPSRLDGLAKLQPQFACDLAANQLVATDLEKSRGEMLQFLKANEWSFSSALANELGRRTPLSVGSLGLLLEQQEPRVLFLVEHLVLNSVPASLRGQSINRIALPLESRPRVWDGLRRVYAEDAATLALVENRRQNLAEESVPSPEGAVASKNPKLNRPANALSPELAMLDETVADALAVLRLMDQIYQSSGAKPTAKNRVRPNLSFEKRKWRHRFDAIDDLVRKESLSRDRLTAIIHQQDKILRRRQLGDEINRKFNAIKLISPSFLSLVEGHSYRFDDSEGFNFTSDTFQSNKQHLSKCISVLRNTKLWTVK